MLTPREGGRVRCESHRLVIRPVPLFSSRRTIPARYVSGYLRTVPRPGEAPIVGADQSHAWVAVYLGAAGWVELDPTNDCLASEDHIPIARGRDYDDVVPVKGVILGGGDHRLTVSVDVSEVPRAAHGV